MEVTDKIRTAIRFASPHILAVFLFCFIPIQKAIASPTPSFNCAKATTKVEKLICGEDKLSKQEKKLGELVSEIKKNYSDGRLDSFLKGQHVWLKLRSEACVLTSDKLIPSDQTKCLQSVYDERIKELAEQKTVDASIDVDNILDADETLSPYYPQDMGSVYFLYNGDIDFKLKRTPQTCRELYTLTSGAWKYTADTIGGNSQTHAYTTCAFKIFSSQNHTNENSGTKIDFGDLTQYSNEFSCLEGFPACRDIFRTYPISFQDEEKNGHLKVQTGITNHSGENFRDYEGNPTLQIEDKKFWIAGTNYIIHNMAVGDFTNQGRQEAILQISAYPSEGTYRNNELVLAYYDETSKSIRPEIIENGSVFILKTKTMPIGYYRERIRSPKPSAQ